MPTKEVNEWIMRADKDLSEAKFLFENSRPFEDVAYFVQQSIEKYFKAFLILNGWELQKTHDLVRLVKEAAKFDQSLEKFVPIMETITDYYLESRYPLGYQVEYETGEMEEAIKNAESVSIAVKERILGR